MQTTYLKTTRGIILFLFIAILLNGSCKKKKGAGELTTPDYNPLISAFTSGIVSNQTNIRVRLSSPVDKEISVNSEVEENVFSFSPKIDGEAYWIDNRTVEYRPEDILESGTTYDAKFNVSKIMEAPREHKTFEFSFQTRDQSFVVNVDGFSPYINKNLVKNKLEGKLITTDFIPAREIEKVLKASQDNEELKITWSHGGEGKTHEFIVDSVIRREKAGKVELEWNGKQAGIDKVKGRQEVSIPSLSDFKLMETKVVQQPQQHVVLRFSDPLEPKQSLRGLIRMDKSNSLKFEIENNLVKVYPPVRQKGKLTMHIEEGIKNILGYKFKNTVEVELQFEAVKPLVKLSGNGVIVPHSEGLIFPFEAVNLSAVDVKIIQIYENNVGYFLQVNRLDGKSQLKRAGRLIKKETVQLVSDRPIDYGRWNTFSIDLANYIDLQPGAIYRVEIGFRNEHSLYYCEGEEDEVGTTLESEEENYDEITESEMSYWDSYENYYYNDYYNPDYNWEERNNPCSNSYYGRRRAVARNILASNLGIVAKGSDRGNMLFAITDLRTASPLEGVTLELYNYQQQLIHSTKTDNDGFARVDPGAKPFLLIAKKGEERGYLRLDDGSSLSLSNFDTRGKKIQKGIKGYIYGERGVWRPGDTLFLNFILEDEENRLPENHPVVFELIDPRGQLAKRDVATIALDGFYNFTTPTSPDDPTGNYTAKFKVGGVEFSKTLKIETVKPNRLKLNLDFGVDKLSVTKRSISGTLNAKWLHGATAGNLKADVNVKFSEAPTNFESYPNYVFDDPVRDFSSDEKTIFEGKLDDNGNASISTSIHVSDAAPGMLKASFTTRVFEQGGEYSIDRFSIPYSPYSSYVGIKTPAGDKRGMLQTDTAQWVKVVTVNDDGKPISRGNLDVKIYKVSWRWWWDASEDNLANYVGSSYHDPVFSTKVDTRDGKGKFSFRINYPSWGRYLIRVTDPVSGHATGKTVYIDWPGWAGRNRENPAGAAMLSFTADKEKYKVGEFANITFPSSGTGRALISIETGSTVHEAYWVEPSEKETPFNFKVTEEMAPNIYVHITLVQPHAQTANDLPIRLYGVIPLMVENPATKLQPVISMPDVLRPEEKFTLEVSEEDDKEMTYTVAIVDEGLLDLTRFKTPNPWESFYAREALGIKTWDVYDMVLGAYGGKIEQLFAIGGDGEIVNPGDKDKANRFKPVVKFLGPFKLKKGRTNSHEIKLPHYVGSVRTMVVAGNGFAYGSSDKTTPVKKPLMVLATLPRVLGPGERVKLPVTVFAMENNIKKVKIDVDPNEYLQPVGETSKTIHFNKTGDKVVNYEFKVKEKLGVAKVNVQASSGKEKAKHYIELDVRNPNPPVTTFVEGIIEPGETWNKDFKLPGIKGTNSVTLEVSSIPPIDFGRRLKYLIGYPHGCLEQTVSKAFPQLYLHEVIEVKGEEEVQMEQNVNAALNKIRKFMLSSGGFAFWPGAREANDWATSYAGHFMLEAEARGFTLPSGLKGKWLRYQRKAARDWSRSRGRYRYYAYKQTDLQQAYRLYTLSLAGEAELGAMNRLREKSDLDKQAAWRLAAAYAMAGRKEIGLEMVNKLSTEVEPYKGFSTTYGSSERDMAMILETLVLLDEREKAYALVQKISKILSSNRWLSTQTTSYSLLAISKFTVNTTSSDLSYMYTINENKSVKASTEMPVSQVSIDKADFKGSNKVEVTNHSEGVIFARVVMTGQPAVGDETLVSENLNMNIRYTTMEGTALNVEQMEQGKDFLAKVTISNPGLLGNYKDMALTQVFPSGWEIHNTRMDEGPSMVDANIPEYQDIRDDRVYTYFDLPARKSKTFVIQLNASYLGKFYLPSITCEAMYDNSIQARVPGKWVEVITPGKNE